MRKGRRITAILLVFMMLVTMVPETIVAGTSVSEENFITMTAEEILHHTVTEKEYYKFSPQTSGWYDLCMTDDTGNTFTSGVYETIYHTAEDGEQIEHTREYTNYHKNAAVRSEHLLWLNQDEVYVFYCVPASYEDPDTIDIALSIRQVEIAGMEVVTPPAEPSTGDFIGTGMQVKISYQDSADGTISDVLCNYQVTSDGKGYAANYLEAFSWSGIAYQKNVSLNHLIRVNTVDGNADTDFSKLENGEHTAELSVTYTQENKLRTYEFSAAFVKSDDTIESISVVDKRDTYTQWFSERLNDASLKITYNDGSKDMTIPADAYGLVSGAKQYLSYEAELPDGTKGMMYTDSIDDYLKNGGDIGEAEVTVAYQGRTVTYPIQIQRNPYQGITEVKPARTVYYTNAGYADGTYQYAGDSINAYQAGKISLSRTDGADAETFDNLLCVPGGGDYFDYGLRSGDRRYKSIDAYIKAGGTTGMQQLEVSYLSTQASAEVEIKENPYTKIEILNKPDKLSYTYVSYGTKIDFSGLVFAAYKEDGTYDTYTYNNASATAGIEGWKRFFHSPYADKTVVLEEGMHTIPVIFMNMKTEFEISVAKEAESEDNYRSFKITKEPDRTVYYVNEKESAVNNCFDEEGLELEAVDAEGVTRKYKMWYYPTKEEQKETGFSSWSDLSMLVSVDSSAIDYSKAGTYPVTVILENKKAVFHVTVADTPIRSFEILSMPDKNVYYRYEGSAMDLSGMAYQITFDDGSIYADTITDNRTDMRFTYQGRLYQIKKSWSKTNSSGNPTIRDDNAIVFSVFGQTYATDAICIKEDPVASIEFLKNPKKKVYAGEDKDIDLYGGKFRITYTDQSTEEISVTEHISTIETDRYKKPIKGRIDYLSAEGSDTLQKYLTVSYMNQSASILIEKNYLSNGASIVTENQWNIGVLSKNKPYFVEQFTPEQTKEYYFYCIDTEDSNMGSQSYFIEIYADGKNIYRMQYSDSSKGLGMNLEAGVTYDYVVSPALGSIFGNYQCCISSAVSDLRDLGEPQIEILQAGQSIWYETEMDPLKLELSGTTYRKTYANGWIINKTITSNMPIIYVEQKPLTVEFKYTQEQDVNQPQIRDDNALIYRYQDDIIKEVPIQLNVPSKIASISIDNNPFANCYRYEVDSGLKTLEGLMVTIHFTDDREAETVRWDSPTDTPYLDGKAVTAMLMASRDEYSLSVRYRGVSKEEKITFAEAPVTGFTVRKQPEKMGYYAFETVGAADLYGMELLIHYLDGSTKEISVTEHTNRCAIEDGYTGVLSGSIRTESTQTDEKALYLSYLGHTEKILEYETYEFPAESAKKLEIGKTNYIVAGEDASYALFSITADTGSHYTVKLDGKVSRYLCRYDQKGNQTDRSYGSSSSVCEVSFDLSAGETTYLAAVLNEKKKVVSLSCIAEGTENKKDDILADESRLQFHNRSNTVFDTMTGSRNKTIADNTDGQNNLPELESYTDDTMQFFYGWYMQKDDNLNGIQTRFTKNTKLTEEQYDLYAKWGSGTFDVVTGQVDVEYKVLSFDDEDRMRIQVLKVSQAAEDTDSKDGIEATGEDTVTLEIPGKFSEEEIPLAKSLGINISDCIVDSVAPYAFADCEVLGQVVLPDTMTNIPKEAFAGAKNLKITLSDAVTEIDPAAFADTDGITVICGSSLAEKENISHTLADQNVTVQTVDLVVSDGIEEKTFTYGDAPQTFTVKAVIDGVEVADPDVSFFYDDTDAYAYSAGRHTLTVTPKRATKAAEQTSVCIRENNSGIRKTITFCTAKGTQTITAKDLLKNTGNVAFSVGAKTSGDGKMHYTSSDPSVAAVDAYGIVRIYKEGTVTITITAEETDNYFASEAKYITLKVEPLKSETKNSQEDDNSGLCVRQTFYKKTYKSKVFRLNITSILPVTYSSSNEKVAVVKPDGMVTVKKCGVALITVHTLKADKTVLIQVVPRQPKVRTSSKKAGTLKVSWSKQKEASGYLVECSLDKNFKKKVIKKVIKKNKTTSATFKKLAKGKKYYVRVRAYSRIDKKNLYGDAGKILRQKIKK